MNIVVSLSNSSKIEELGKHCLAISIIYSSYNFFNLYIYLYLDRSINHLDIYIYNLQAVTFSLSLLKQKKLPLMAATS